MKVMKKKTSLQLSQTLVMQAADLGRVLGLGKGAIISMSLAFFVAKFATVHLAPSKKRRQVLNDVEKEFQKLMVEAREGPSCVA